MEQYDIRFVCLFESFHKLINKGSVIVCYVYTYIYGMFMSLFGKYY